MTLESVKEICLVNEKGHVVRKSRNFVGVLDLPEQRVGLCKIESLSESDIQAMTLVLIRLISHLLEALTKEEEVEF